MSYLHTGVFGKTLVDDLRKQGFSRSAIVGNTGIDLGLLQGDEPKVPFDMLATLFERAAELTGDNLLGHKHAQNSDYRRLGLIAFTGVSSPNVRSLLHTLARYQRINSDVLLVDNSKLDSEGVLEWHYQVPRHVVRRQFIEFNATGLLQVLRYLTGRRLTPKEIAFRHLRKSNKEELTRFFGLEPVLGDAENRVRFSPEQLDLRLNTSDHLLNRMLTKFSEEALRDRIEPKASIVNRVEDVLASNLGLTQAAVARELGMSARTLSRRLAEEGTTFARIVEEYRASMAKGLLQESDLQVTEIAFVLGYSELSTFSTAFRRWTGKTPLEFRNDGSR